MNEKRFKYTAFDGFEENGEYITPHQVATLLNEYYEENKQLKRRLMIAEDKVKGLMK